MKRGEIWLTDFGEPSGPKQAGKRPAIIFQDNSLTPGLSTVVVIPLTTNLKRLALPSTVQVAATETGLDKDSVVLCHQIQVRGKARCVERLGELPEGKLAEVEECLMDTLGL